jgi:hypothetical protein
VRRHHLDEQKLQRAVQQAVREAGLADVKATMIYTHVLNKGPMGVISPVDTL